MRGPKIKVFVEIDKSCRSCPREKKPKGSEFEKASKKKVLKTASYKVVKKAVKKKAVKKESKVLAKAKAEAVKLAMAAIGGAGLGVLALLALQKKERIPATLTMNQLVLLAAQQRLLAGKNNASTASATNLLRALDLVNPDALLAAQLAGSGNKADSPRKPSPANSPGKKVNSSIPDLMSNRSSSSEDENGFVPPGLK